ncbi:MAG: hypothetical protein IV100_30360 [Myxococcales bacterium]|nr:hypothetical protein [Myxococcales bacterium]
MRLGSATASRSRRGAVAWLATIMFAACGEIEATAIAGVDISDASTTDDISVSVDVVDIADDSGPIDDAPDLSVSSDLEAPDSVEDPHPDGAPTDLDTLAPSEDAAPSEDVGCTQTLPECPPGDIRTATDLDGDGCPDACCFSECPTDFVSSDINGDGCGDSCGDKPCTAASDCSLYTCSFGAGNCSTPQGVCSNFACKDAGPVCGCDGITYETGCLANAAGVPVATDGECPPPT